MNLDFLTKEIKFEKKTKPAKKKETVLNLAKDSKGKDILCFDFGAFSTKVAVCRVVGKGITVKKMVTIENETSFTGLNETNIATQATRIQEELTKAGIKTSGRLALCTLSNRNFIVRKITVPDVEEGSLLGVIGYEMCNKLALNHDEYCFQYKKFDEKAEEGYVTVIGSALSKATCNYYYQLMDLLKVTPYVLDMNLNAIERVMNRSAKYQSVFNSTATCTVDYGHKTTEISFFINGQFIQRVSVDYGESKFVTVAKIVLGLPAVDVTNEGKLIVKPKEILDRLQKFDFGNNKMLLESVKTLFESINSEIKRFNISHPQNEIKTIYLYTGSPQAEWLGPSLQAYANVPTVLLDDYSMYNIDGVENKNEYSRFLNALSLTLVE